MKGKRQWRINRSYLQDIADKSIDAVFVHLCSFSANPAREEAGGRGGEGAG